MDKSIFSPGTVLSVLCHVIILIGFSITVLAVVSGSVSLWIQRYKRKEGYPSMGKVLPILGLTIVSLTVIILSVLEVMSSIHISAAWGVPSSFILVGMAKTIFDQVPSNNIPRAKFNLSYDRKLSFNQGELIPIMCKEALPGDSFEVGTNIMGRLAPLIGPAYTRMKVKCESFFVPVRILWDEPDFEKWITGGPDGNDTAVHPYFKKTDLSGTYKDLLKKGTLWDYMGLPVTAGIPAAPPKISVLPFRALWQIYNDWYAIPGIVSLNDFSKASGEISGTEVGKLLDWQGALGVGKLFRRAWSRDYFTSAQPYAQRGGAASAPIDIIYSAQSDWKYEDGTPVPVEKYAGSSQVGAAPTGGIAGKLQAVNAGGATGAKARIENISYAGLLVEKFRIASAVQKFVEAMSRGGSRYVEQNWQMFKVKSKDQRLQRAEFISGYTGPMQISEVLSTVQFEGTSDLPQGTMAGHGIHVGGSPKWRYKAEEHGYFITLMSVVPEGGRYGSGLFSGIDKMFQRFDRYDLYWPLFANLGEQEIKRKELSYNLDNATGESWGDETFGYCPRYSDYKWSQSTVHADFRDELDTWTQNRGWTPDAFQPILNGEFCLVNKTEDDLDRIFAVQDPDVDKLWFYIYQDISAFRPMPYNPIPGI